MRIWLALALIGCDSGPKESPVSKPDESPRRAGADAAGDAISVVQPALLEDAAVPVVVHPLTTGWLDAPAWPATGDTLEIAWLVGTDHIPRKSDPDILEAPLSVVVTIGGVSRQAYLKQQFGSLKPYYQTACPGVDPTLRPKGSLAQIMFTEGGQGGYYVRRKGSDVLEILSWEQEDGACEVHGQLGECPRREVAAVRMHVPAKRAHESIFHVDAAGNRTPLDCKSD